MLDSRQRSIWIRFMAVVALVAQAFAQGGATGAITGTVQDTSSAFVANADVQNPAASGRDIYRQR